MDAAEYRALGQLMRWARANGYTYYVTTSFGRTDWSWSKDGLYAVTAEPMGTGWRVTFNGGSGGLWPASVQQLTDVLVAVGLLPVEFRSPAQPVVDVTKCEAPQSVGCEYPPTHVAEYYTGKTALLLGEPWPLMRKIPVCGACVNDVPGLHRVQPLAGAR